MATALVNAMPLNEAKVWKGGSRLVLGATVSPPAVPTKLESIIDPATYALQTGWTDFGALNEDGITIGREWDIEEGIATDQRGYNLRAGGITNVTMSMTATSLYTDAATLKIIWGLNDITQPTPGAGTSAQDRVEIGAPIGTVERQVVILQQNDASPGKIRAFYFRRASLAEPSELNIQASDASANEFTFNLSPDASITDGSEFGLIYEQT